MIAGDMAGLAEVSIDTSIQRAAQHQFLVAMSGLALLLSMGVYLATRTMAKRPRKKFTASQCGARLRYG